MYLNATMAYSDDHKTDARHHEVIEAEADATSKPAVSTEITHNLSKEAPMTLFQCLKKYKYASFVCLLASIGALSDGYQVQMSGSIIALPGFIQQFGDLQEDGTRVINPQYISLWGCEYLPR